MQAATKVFFNTGVLYLRMLLTVGISLYTTRLVLNALGVDDFGIYNLIAGIITMLSFLNTAMAVSTQRYLSFYQGRKDKRMQKMVFANSFLLHILIGLSVVILLEAIGVFLFDGFLNIPVDRIEVARIIYHFMSLTVFFTIVAVPFSGSLYAHENILWVAIVTIIEVLLKLGIAILLYTINFDKLIFYGFTMAVVSIVSLLLYMIFCMKKYEECSLKARRFYDKSLMKELSSFAGWNLFGAICGVGRSQGLAVILNLFFGTIVNAAYAIANQISGQLNFFSATMLRALNPQIMKSEGAGDRQRMLRLSMSASKFGFFLLAFIAIPCIFEMPSILKFWLKEVPDYTIVFCDLILIGIMITQLTVGLQSAIQATGKIKIYQSIIGFIILLNLPLAYLLLSYGMPAYSVLITYILMEIIACIFRLFILRKIAGLIITEYIYRVFVRIIFPLSFLLLVCYFITTFFNSPYRFLFTMPISAVIFFIGIYILGLERNEKKHVHKIIYKLMRKS